MPWVGIVDDYATEKAEIRDEDMRRQYSPSAHIVNILLNWVPEIDRLDDSYSIAQLAWSRISSCLPLETCDLM